MGRSVFGVACVAYVTYFPPPPSPGGKEGGGGEGLTLHCPGRSAASKLRLCAHTMAGQTRKEG
jgi:hypothetical protein